MNSIVFCNIICLEFLSTEFLQVADITEDKCTVAEDIEEFITWELLQLIESNYWDGVE